MSLYQRSGKRPQYCRKSRGPICRHSALAIPRTSCKCCVGKTMLEQLGLESGLGLEEHLSGHWELFAPAWTSFLRLLSWSLKFSEGCCDNGTGSWWALCTTPVFVWLFLLIVYHSGALAKSLSLPNPAARVAINSCKKSSFSWLSSTVRGLYLLLSSIQSSTVWIIGSQNIPSWKDP